MSELKRCPFCGGELGFRTWIAFDGESYFLKCSTKDCLFNFSSFKNKKDLIKKANTRKPMERIMERLEEYEGTYVDVDIVRGIIKEEGMMNE